LCEQQRKTEGHEKRRLRRTALGVLILSVNMVSEEKAVPGSAGQKFSSQVIGRDAGCLFTKFSTQPKGFLRTEQNLGNSSSLCLCVTILQIQYGRAIAVNQSVVMNLLQILSDKAHWNTPFSLFLYDVNDQIR